MGIPLLTVIDMAGNTGVVINPLVQDDQWGKVIGAIMLAIAEGLVQKDPKLNKKTIIREMQEVSMEMILERG